MSSTLINRQIGSDYNTQTYQNISNLLIINDYFNTSPNIFINYVYKNKDSDLKVYDDNIMVYYDSDEDWWFIFS